MTETPKTKKSVDIRLDDESAAVLQCLHKSAPPGLRSIAETLEFQAATEPEAESLQVLGLIDNDDPPRITRAGRAHVEGVIGRLVPLTSDEIRLILSVLGLQINERAYALCDKLMALRKEATDG
jgi:hypothetical protein